MALPILLCASAQAGTQDHSQHGGHIHNSASTAETLTATQRAKLAADKEESEFNHHLAGFFVALGGMFVLIQKYLKTRWPRTQYVWPATFLLSGAFVLVWSDTELWPFGNRSWLEQLQHDPEVLQHKLFALLLLGLGCVEWQRVTGALRSTWSAWVFPILAISGSVLLLFHQHQGGMHGPNHMELMARIQSQHLSYAALGIGIAVSKGLSEATVRRRDLFGTIWPLLMTGLGILLMFYRE
jgi:putative copper resistance protein D